MSNEPDTCRTLVLPRLYAAGWTDEQIAEQRTFTDGRIVVQGNRASRRLGKRADYLLRYTCDKLLSIIEAKASFKKAADGEIQFTLLDVLGLPPVSYHGNVTSENSAVQTNSATLSTDFKCPYIRLKSP